MISEPMPHEAAALRIAKSATKEKDHGLAWTHLRTISRETWIRSGPVEFISAALYFQPERAFAECQALANSLPSEIADASWVQIVKMVYGTGNHQLAHSILSALDTRIGKSRLDLDERLACDLAWLRQWMRDGPKRSRASAQVIGRPSFAVINYKQADYRHTSKNLGDYVQTVASLGQLARHENITFTGEPALAAFATRLKLRVRDDRVIRDGPAVSVNLVEVNRDGSNDGFIADRTWMLAFGWYMSSQFERKFDFPFNASLRPIFISFHVNQPKILTPSAIEYLRRYSPIGCRDWTTVRVLRRLGVPAFLSGCITATIDNVFPERAQIDRSGFPVACVNVPAQAAGAGESNGKPAPVMITHDRREVREGDLSSNLEAALQQLEDYRQKYSKLLTSRLHCWLPATALGVNVDFMPPDRTDIRFDGLLQVENGGLPALRDPINTKLAATLPLMFNGTDERAVYGTWAELCADDVATAEHHMQASGTDY